MTEPIFNPFADLDDWDTDIVREAAPARRAPVVKKVRKQLIYKLRATPAIKEALADIVKVQFEMRIKSAMNYTLGSYPTFEEFRDRKMAEKGQTDITLLRKLYTPEQVNEYLNTFITAYVSAKEKYDREQRERELKRSKRATESTAS